MAGIPDLKINFCAPGEWGGVRSFTGDDGDLRRMWTVSYLGGKISGFLDDEKTFDILSSVPAGTPSRAFGLVEVASDDNLKLVASSFAIDGATENFKPLDSAEVIRGCVFSGLVNFWLRSQFKDGSFNLRFNTIGSSFLVRDVSKGIFDKFDSPNQNYRVKGLLRTDVIYKGTRRVPSVGVALLIEDAKLFNN